jgi:long-chain acyl-CoA synthetase
MSHTDLADLLADAAAQSPDKTAVVESEGRSVTWAQLDDQASRVACGLADRGVIAGQRVLLALTNRIEFISAYFAVLRLQAVAVPVNPRANGDEIARIAADCGARLAIGEARTLPALRTVAELKIVCVDATAGTVSYADLLVTAPRPLPPLLDPERIAVLLYTSGTSGEPRAAMLSHRALLANLEQTAAVEPPMMHADDVVLGVLPLFHVYGLNAVLGGVVSRRAKLVLAPRFEPNETLDLIEDEACSVLPLAPAVFPHWLAVDDLEDCLGSVRLVLSGSAQLAGDVVEEFTARTGVPVHQGFGLTEAAPVVTTTLRSESFTPGSLGAAIPGVEVRLVDEQGDLLERDDPGSIQIKGDNLFSGYWPDGSDGPGADGWWSTGDLGFLDEHGNLTLVDRVSELITVSGFTVYPHEGRARRAVGARRTRRRRDRGWRTTAPARPWWRTCSRRGRTPTRSRQPCAHAPPALPVSNDQVASRWSTRCRPR